MYKIRARILRLEFPLRRVIGLPSLEALSGVSLSCQQTAWFKESVSAEEGAHSRMGSFIVFLTQRTLKVPHWFGWEGRPVGRAQSLSQALSFCQGGTA
jgi:hypothetical protein